MTDVIGADLGLTAITGVPTTDATAEGEGLHQ